MDFSQYFRSSLQDTIIHLILYNIYMDNITIIDEQTYEIVLPIRRTIEELTALIQNAESDLVSVQEEATRNINRATEKLNKLYAEKDSIISAGMNVEPNE